MYIGVSCPLIASARCETTESAHKFRAFLVIVARVAVSVSAKIIVWSHGRSVNHQSLYDVHTQAAMPYLVQAPSANYIA